MSTALGRSCPLHYRYRPGELAGAPLVEAEVAWVAGGLYGNPEALSALRSRVAAERAAGVEAVLVFNGDFHWFDTDPRTFERLQRMVLDEHALTGNIELELARPDAGAGCGCAYPEFVDDATVERSNRIIERLRATATSVPGAAAALARLPRVLRLQVGDTVTGVIHGDPESIAGWQLAIEHVHGGTAPLTAERVTRWARAAAVDAFASSHTCLPWAGRFGDLVVINNGSAGMANFRGDARGIVTRIAAVEAAHPEALYAVEAGGTRWEAVPVAFDTAAWWRRFECDWPPGSAAHESYAERIRHGPWFEPRQARPCAGGAGGPGVDSAPAGRT